MLRFVTQEKKGVMTSFYGDAQLRKYLEGGLFFCSLKDGRDLAKPWYRKMGFG